MNTATLVIALKMAATGQLILAVLDLFIARMSYATFTITYLKAALG